MARNKYTGSVENIDSLFSISTTLLKILFCDICRFSTIFFSIKSLGSIVNSIYKLINMIADIDYIQATAHRTG